MFKINFEYSFRNSSPIFSNFSPAAGSRGFPQRYSAASGGGVPPAFSESWGRGTCTPNLKPGGGGGTHCPPCSSAEISSVVWKVKKTSIAEAIGIS